MKSVVCMINHLSFAAVPSKIHSIILTRAVKSAMPAIEVSWESPISERSIIKYKVRYREIRTRQWSQKLVIANVTCLENLTVDTDYVIQIRATSDAGTGSYSNAQILETFAGNKFKLIHFQPALIDEDNNVIIICLLVFSLVPTKVSEVVVTGAVRSSKPALLIEWATYEANERVTAYQVQYRQNFTGEWSKKELPSASNSTYIDNLDFGTLYQIRVNALTDIGATTFGDIEQQKTYNGMCVIVLPCVRDYIPFWNMLKTAFQMSVLC